MAPPIARIEVATNWTRGGGGSLLGCLVDARAPLTDESIENNRVRMTRFSFSLPILSAAVAFMVIGHVVVVRHADATPYVEYKIQDIRAAVLGGDAMLQVQAVGVLASLGEGDLPVSQTVAGVTSYLFNVTPDTAANLLSTWSIATAPPYWSLGTVTPTAFVGVAVTEDETALSFGIKVADAVAEATGVQYQLQERPNGTAGYFLDLVIIGATATSPVLRTGKNLTSLSYQESRLDQVTRLVLVSYDRRGPADARAKVSAINAGVSIDTVDINGGIGAAREDDQYNGAYIVRQNGTTQIITDTVFVDALTTRFLLANTTNITVGDSVGIAGDSGGGPLPYLDAPAAKATYGIIKRTLPNLPSPVTNRVADPSFRNGLADWAVTGAPVAITTPGKWLFDGVSYRLGSGTFDQIGQTPSIYCVAEEVWTYQVWLNFDVISAGVNNDVLLTDPQTGATTSHAFGVAPEFLQTNVWVPFYKSYAIATTGVKTFGFAIKTSLGSATRVYVAGAQIIRSSVAGLFQRGSGGFRMLQLGNLHFDIRRLPPRSYNVGVVDLTRADGSAFPDDELALGPNLILQETESGINDSTLRIIRVLSDGEDDTKTQVTLANRPSDLSLLFARSL